MVECRSQQMLEPQGNFQTVQLFLGVCISGGEGKARGSLGSFCFSFFVEHKSAPLGSETGLRLLARGALLRFLEITFALPVGTLALVS